MNNNFAWLRDQFAQYSLKKAPPGESFTLASGKKSSFYFDVRKTAQRAGVMSELSRSLKAAWLTMPPASTVAGVVLGGCHLATMLAMAVTPTYMLDVIYVRKEAKAHGTGNLIEAPRDPRGEVFNYREVIVMEDVFTTGGSSKKAIEELQAAGYSVEGLLVVLDRRNPKDRTDTFEGVVLRSLFKLEDFGLTEDAE